MNMKVDENALDDVYSSEFERGYARGIAEGDRERTGLYADLARSHGLARRTAFASFVVGMGFGAAVGVAFTLINLG